ncbi:helix-turn-helix domain-containing protein [Paenibacillus durus]|uniref:helix-turn-helix domain-containing protein n=1 Tax=Paenibacillus durus TaxID=44251 RepID=UPI002E7FFA84|nr:helix-turn-helix domain-containing protein [Paenibacillus durus]
MCTEDRTFTEEQVVQIVAIACEDPKDCGRPISHWTPREVRDEAVKRGIVPAISVTQVGRFLK